MPLRYQLLSIVITNSNHQKPPLPHTRRLPFDRFKGSSQQGTYGDVIQEIDWQVRELMSTLDDLGIANNPAGQSGGAADS